MMLSDDFSRSEARERALEFAGNREINELAASGISFTPVESNNGSASGAFVATVNGKQYVALFHWFDGEEVVRLDCRRAGILAGIRYRELWSGETVQDEDGVICWKVCGCDAAVLREI